MLERIRKWLALRSYKSRLRYLLIKGYGREAYYTPPQVLTAIKEYGLSERYAVYACAMFCSKHAFADFVSMRALRPETGFNPLHETSIPLWAGALAQEWPAHHEVVAELRESHGGFSDWNFASDNSGNMSSGFGDSNFGGGDSSYGEGSAEGGSDTGGGGGEGGSSL